MVGDRSIRSMDLTRLVSANHEKLSPSERKVAEALLREPEHVAFGTLAEFANRAGTSGTTVLRLATKLGFDGFGPLQSRVQNDLSHRLRPARQKIREEGVHDPLARTLTLAVENLHATFSGVDYARFTEAAERIARCSGRVFVLPGECVMGAGGLIVDQLSNLRDGIVFVDGNATKIGKLLRQAGEDDVTIVIDQSRYDRWLLDALSILTTGRTYVIAFSDSPISPLAAVAQAAFTINAEGAGPFDSQIATLALGEALIAAVATFLAQPATERLDSVEQNWRALNALTDGAS